MTKKVFFAFTLALTMLASCNKDETKSSNNNLIGRWQITASELETSFGNESFYIEVYSSLEFLDEKTCIFYDDVHTYSLRGDTLDLHSDLGVFLIKELTEKSLHLDINNHGDNWTSTGFLAYKKI